jgi:hypothetical protein
MVNTEGRIGVSVRERSLLKNRGSHVSLNEPYKLNQSSSQVPILFSMAFL